MFQLTNQALGAADPDYLAEVVGEDERGTVAAQNRTAMVGRARMMEFFTHLMDRCRAEPRDDLVSILLESEVDGEKLDSTDILAFCFLLVLAGNETTRNAISGGHHVLCEHQAERAKLQADMSLKILFEELFRRYPDIQLDGPPQRLRSNFINGIKPLPVTLAT
jgi:cytochrome P450